MSKFSEPEMEGIATWYRFEEELHAEGYMNDAGAWRPSSFGPRIEIRLVKVTVLRMTEKGMWFASAANDRPVWRSRTSTRRYACPTVDEALESFILRKRAQIKKLKKQLDIAERALSMAVMLRNPESKS